MTEIYKCVYGRDVLGIFLKSMIFYLKRIYSGTIQTSLKNDWNISPAFKKRLDCFSTFLNAIKIFILWFKHSTQSEKIYPFKDILKTK